MKNNQENFDVAVIGAGSAGLMAALWAAQKGARGAGIEKNDRAGRKLLLSGGGRCNLTQARSDNREFAKKLGKNGEWLLSALSIFGPKETRKFFESRGLKTKKESNGRIFPISDRAQEVLDLLLKDLKEKKVKIFFGEKVSGFNVSGDKISSVKSGDRKIAAKSFILCAGGKSYSVTGSIGDGYIWAKDMGHKIIHPVPALVPIETQGSWPKELQGLSLKGVQLNILQNGKKEDSYSGEMLFTHFGLSGPIVLNASKKVGELLAKGEVLLEIDLAPNLSADQLDKKLRRDFAARGDMNFKTYLATFMPQRMAEKDAKFCGVSLDEKLGSIIRQSRKKTAAALKSLRTGVRGLMGFDQAIMTSGGVDLKEIDSRTMKSKIIENLFFAGEIIDLDGPTGGYNLQICWTTGYIAGSNATGGI